MTGRCKLTRREALRALAALIGGCLGGVSTAEAFGALDRIPSDGALQSGDALRAVGRAYLRSRPEEANAVSLVQILQGRRAKGSSRVEEGVAVRPGSWPERIRRDYERDETVLVNGWLLSRTEARLCAAYALTGEGPLRRPAVRDPRS